MSLDVALLLIRAAVALALYVFLAAILYIIWQDVAATGRKIQESRRPAGKLIVVECGDVPLSIGDQYLLRLLTTLGRGLTSTVVIPDSFASTDHARVILRGSQWWLEDQHSRNGTLVNNMPVTEPVVLSSGDIIGIGSVKLRIELG